MNEYLDLLQQIDRKLDSLNRKIDALEPALLEDVVDKHLTKLVDCPMHPPTHLRRNACSLCNDFGKVRVKKEIRTFE